MEEDKKLLQDSANTDDIKTLAKHKLEEELSKAKDKSFAEPIITFLLGRCEGDNGLSEDVMQEHKTWEKCFDYIYAQARKQSKGSRCAVRDEVVYEWAEDYYHKDDKAEEEEKAKKEAERRKKAAERKDKPKHMENDEAEDEKPYVMVEKSYDEVMEEESNKPPKKKKTKEVDGQMDLFSMMEM